MASVYMRMFLTLSTIPTLVIYVALLGFNLRPAAKHVLPFPGISYT